MNLDSIQHSIDSKIWAQMFQAECRFKKVSIPIPFSPSVVDLDQGLLVAGSSPVHYAGPLHINNVFCVSEPPEESFYIDVSPRQFATVPAKGAEFCSPESFGVSSEAR